MEMLTFDAVVIGGGSAGYAAARALVAGGATVAVVDSAPELGGLCILRGCMPTKALLHAAELRHAMEEAKHWGIHPGEVQIDIAALFGRKATLIEQFAAYRRDQLQAGKFQLLRARASFVDAHTLQLSDGRQVRAGHVVLATGSKVGKLPLPALETIGCQTSDDLVDHAHLPASLIVLGGGAVGLEFAQFYSRLGTRVSVIQRNSQILREFDQDAAAEVEKAFRREGIEVFTGTRLLDARKSADQSEILFEQGAAPGSAQWLSAEAVLHGMGRAPNLDGLNLSAAGVSCESGGIDINARQQSSVGHIYAAGDCCGPYEIVHLAIQQGEVAAHNILRPSTPRSMDYRILLSVVFTDPQVAQVGLTEKEATRQGLAYAAASYPFNDHGKSMILGCQEGFVKLLASRSDGEILGGTCVGPQGGELIHEIAVAMGKRMTVHEFVQVPHYHPTLAEIWTYPAEELVAELGS
jgi:pyruvate/2-oxoglutarate dehydrogenase complex dihydrolipoamide dehydrogenase (E3) component